MNEVLAASFRDPSGFLFRRDGVLYRQVNRIYAEDYGLLNSTGLRDRLLEKGLLMLDGEPKQVLDEYLRFCQNPMKWMRRHEDVAKRLQ